MSNGINIVGDGGRRLREATAWEAWHGRVMTILPDGRVVFVDPCRPAGGVAEQHAWKWETRRPAE